MKQQNLLGDETVSLDIENNLLVILDQTKLPQKREILYLKTPEEIWTAIRTLQVRGAPAIGVAAAIGLYVATNEIDTTEYEVFFEQLKKTKEYLATARPTAVNLFWALNRMEQVAVQNHEKTIAQIKKLLLREAKEIRSEDIRVSRAIGEYGLMLIQNGDGILTYCNAGQLAAVKYGTALAPIYIGKEKGYDFRVFSCETRPLLQGIRLTAYELMAHGVDVTVLCDNMVSQVMKQKWIQAVFVGCDHVASNGDCCNKIGTSGIAVLAKHYQIPFYVCSPTSTIDWDMKCSDDIVIEQRDPEEVTDMWYQQRIAPDGVKVYNPAFDCTPGDLVTAIITEYGIARPPYTESLVEIMTKKRSEKNRVLRQKAHEVR